MATCNNCHQPIDFNITTPPFCPFCNNEQEYSCLICKERIDIINSKECSNCKYYFCPRGHCKCTFTKRKIPYNFRYNWKTKILTLKDKKTKRKFEFENKESLNIFNYLHPFVEFFFVNYHQLKDYYRKKKERYVCERGVPRGWAKYQLTNYQNVLDEFPENSQYFNEIKVYLNKKGVGSFINLNEIKERLFKRHKLNSKGKDNTFPRNMLQILCCEGFCKRRYLPRKTNEKFYDSLFEVIKEKPCENYRVIGYDKQTGEPIQKCVLDDKDFFLLKKLRRKKENA